MNMYMLIFLLYGLVCTHFALASKCSSENDGLTCISSDHSHKYNQKMQVKQIHWMKKKRILVTGGAGFVGSHLVDRLMQEGHEVIVVDNFATGRRHNIEHWIGHSNFELMRHDVINPLFVEVDEIYHLASPASPINYVINPIKTIKVNTVGTLNMLGLARRTKAKFLFASTSEVYGDPLVHPQPESYWGHVNPIGPRACYDESKRLGETLTYAYANRLNMSVRIARIFNTYGPRMQVDDGRVVSNFIIQALTGKPMTVYGNGQQTRSFQYISDLVDGLVALMESNYTAPVNLGNPDEFSVSELADLIKIKTGSKSSLINLPLPLDDPQRRRPDISVALQQLGWKPTVKLANGLDDTIDYFRDVLQLETTSKDEL